MMTNPWLALRAAHAAAHMAEQRAFEALTDPFAEDSPGERLAAWRNAKQKTANAWYALHEHACQVT